MFVGTWEMNGRTLDSDEDNVSGKSTFEWLPVGSSFSSAQRSTSRNADLRSGGHRLPHRAQRLPSTVSANMIGVPIPYEYDVQGDDVTITTEFLGATFTGKASKGGKTFSGSWRPMPGRESPGNVTYEITGTRVS